MKISKVIRWGNSWSCAIPKKYWTYLGVTPGSWVGISLKENCIHISPVTLPPKKERKEVKEDERVFNSR